MATEVTGLRSEVKRLISDNLKDREMAEIDKKDSLEKLVIISSSLSTTTTVVVVYVVDGLDVVMLVLSYMKILVRE